MLKRAKNHGGSASAEYTVWRNMRARCLTPAHPRYPDYGGRGIGICERWNSFESFLADVGQRPSPEHSLDRIDNDRGYEPNNCRWATRSEQGRNSRKARKVIFRGKTMTLVEAAHLAKLSPVTVSTRLNKGWSIEKALEEPLRFS